MSTPKMLTKDNENMEAEDALEEKEELVAKQRFQVAQRLESTQKSWIVYIIDVIVK